MAQHHDPVRDLAVLDDLMPYFEDERYIRIRGCPVLLVYRPSLMVDPEGFASRLREEAVRRGLLGLHLCNVMSIGDNDRRAPGFDAAVEFPPNGTIGKEIDPRVLGVDPSFHGRIYDYASLVRTVLARPTPAFPYYPGVMPRWDNTARKGMAAHIFHGSSPEIFESWLQRAASITRLRNPRAPLVFINSWNEWAEGAHLEPDQQTGRRIWRSSVGSCPRPMELIGSPMPMGSAKVPPRRSISRTRTSSGTIPRHPVRQNSTTRHW